MNCFNHNENAAFGTCKNCSKGLCNDCLTDTGNGIACTASCVNEVETLNMLIEKNKKVHNTTVGAGNSAALLYLAIGILCIGTTLLWLKRLDPFLIGLGVVCIVYGLYTLFRTSTLKDRKTSTADNEE